MSDLKLPKAWVTAGKKDTKKVEARIDMSAEVAGQGLCPDCRAPMERAITNGIEVHVCHPDRIAIPIADNMV